MDVERTTPISTDDDPTMHSIQDRPSLQVHHHQDISSNFHNNNKKIHEPFDDSDSDEDNDGNNKIYQEKCGSLRTNERSIPLSQFLQFMLDLKLACVYSYVS
jgi:hypothetical protein